MLQQQPADRIEQMAAAAQVSPLVATLLLIIIVIKSALACKCVFIVRVLSYIVYLLS